MRAAALVGDLLQTRGRGLKNFWGRKVDSPVVVLESDDWGSERVRSREVRDALIRKGVLPPEGTYHSDTLATENDLSALAEVLSAVSDRDGSPAVLSPFVNPANPDFERIRESGFREYAYEPMTRALEARGDASAVLARWRELMAEGLFVPEYHGREHLQVVMWMEWLERDGKVRAGFDYGVYSVSGEGLPPGTEGFRPAYFFRSPAEIQEVGAAIPSGALVFKEIFGAPAECFCPPNNVFHADLVPFVSEAGLRLLMRAPRNPEPTGTGEIRSRWAKPLPKGADIVTRPRNALFEPVAGFSVDHTLGQIASAFRWNVPAVISTHRVNYVGAIEPKVRDKGLASLRELLRRIVGLWPDVRFLSSRQLLAEQHGEHSIR